MTSQHEHRLLRAYERMLERVREYLGRERHLGDALEDAKRRTVELGELSRGEADEIGQYLRRDLEQAGQHLARGNSDLSSWLHMDVQLIENWLWDSFSSVADQTKLQLLELKRQAEQPQLYATGEITGPGALRCVNCDRVLEFRQAGHIPPCPNCHGTRFVRPAG